MPAEAPSIAQSPSTSVAPSNPVTQAADPTAPVNSPAPGSDDMAESFSDLDGMAGRTAQPKAPVKSPYQKETPPEVPKVDVESDLKNQDKPQQQKQELKKPEAKPEKQAGPADLLRAALDKEKKQRIQLEAQVKELREVQPSDHPSVKSMQQRLEAAEKRRDELETEMRFANYERSSEYKDKWEKPFMDAYGLGRQKIAGLEIAEITDEATGQIVQKGRPATPEDFDRIMAISSDREASKLAGQLFGEDKHLALFHREKIMDLNRSRHNAIEEYRKNGSERAIQEAESSKKQLESRNGLWKQANEALEEKFSKWLRPQEGDDEGNGILETSVKQANAAFSDNPNMSQEDAVRLHALVRSRAAAFPRAAYLNSKLESKIQELESELAQFKSSEPKNGEGERVAAPDAMDWESELNSLATAKAF